MATRVKSSADRLDAPQATEFDRMLDSVEPALHAIAAEHGLRQARIDRWRWDQPEVVLSWVDQDKQLVEKNIRFSIDDDEGIYLCSVEVNAWQDERGDGPPVRKWRHEPIGLWRVRTSDEMSADQGHFLETLEKAYDTIAAWDVNDLAKKHYPQNTSAH